MERISLKEKCAVKIKNNIVNNIFSENSDFDEFCVIQMKELLKILNSRINKLDLPIYLKNLIKNVPFEEPNWFNYNISKTFYPETLESDTGIFSVLYRPPTYIGDGNYLSHDIFRRYKTNDIYVYTLLTVKENRKLFNIQYINYLKPDFVYIHTKPFEDFYNKTIVHYNQKINYNPYYKTTYFHVNPMYLKKYSGYDYFRYIYKNGLKKINKGHGTLFDIYYSDTITFLDKIEPCLLEDNIRFIKIDNIIILYPNLCFPKLKILSKSNLLELEYKEI